MRNLRLLALLIVIPLLYGCAAAVIGGAGTAVLVGEDRRTVGTQAEDQGIELKAAGRLRERFRDPHINVTSFNRNILLTGEAPDADTKAQIERIVRQVPNARGVVNEIQIAGVSSFSARGNDSYLTSKVKARFIDISGSFSPNHVKVVTENGVVYLLGLVSRKEAEAAVEIARTTGGVQKVVRVFEYTDTPPAPASTPPSK